MSHTVTMTHPEWLDHVGQYHCQRCDAPNDRAEPCCNQCGRENENWPGDEDG